VTEHTVILECHVLGGFKLKGLSKKEIPYMGKFALSLSEYEKSSRLQEAVKNGWFVLKKNPTRRLNLLFTKTPPPIMVRALPPPQEQKSQVVDREVLKEEIIREMLPQFMHVASQNSKLFEASLGQLLEKIEDQNKKSTPIEELMAKQSEMLKETIQRVVSSSSSGTISVTKQDKDDELFIPDVIKSREMTANLSFEEKSTGSIDEATAALKAMKKGKSNVSG